MKVMLFELMCSVVGLATKPLSLVKVSCVFGAWSISIVIQTWTELLRAAIHLHIIIFWKLAIWTIFIFTLPMRAITALQRERELELQLHGVRTELESVLWDRKELEEQLHMAIRKHKMMQMMLEELEGEHDEAIVRIQLLEGEVQDLKDENQRLKEVRGKTLWSCKDKCDTGSSHDTNSDTKDTNKLGVSGFNRNIDRVMVHEDIWEETRDIVKEGLKSCGPHIIAQDLNTSNILARRRELALSRSLFSAILSLVVGMIVWEAEDPCVPLVIALFTVVTMSLMSVIQFFTTINNKPASDAVALLSFNWFILGTLAYPSLPRAARVLAPLASSVVERTLVWLSLL
ncbi:uncharacterized protein LOC111404281 [Olea europaea var. sylvestris]|uniref:uncharacterized protein LOC111404281 n=1 Tax=Olea europaea var. sylvestris TaxID=158386 RepID=UPI000C1D822E|nr:uncharacterized protein LOC111404281 [Olea europaea var. sylvestris]XP_022888876.1 uncharacterized protein LOC111404281 [Olea europaea var. sylvestris]